MPLVPRFGISHMPVSMDIEEKAIPRDADFSLMWNLRHHSGAAETMYYRHTDMEATLCFGFLKSEWKDLKQRLEEDDDDAWLKAIGVFREANEGAVLQQH